MVQLSLLSEPGAIDLDAHLSALATRAVSRGAVAAHAAAATRATASRFSSWRGRSLTTDETARVRAYFHGVVRRAVIASTDEASRAVYHRLVAASIEADLVAGGWDRARAAEEARRTVGTATRGAVA